MKRYATLCVIVLLAQVSLWAQFPLWDSYVTTTKVNDFATIGQQIWVATDAGLYIYNKADQSVTHLDRSNAALPSNQIEAVAVDDLERIWVGTYDMEMAYQQGDEWVPVHFPDNLFSTEQPVLLYCMEFGPDGSLWVGTSEGLVHRVGDQWSLFNQSTHPSTFLRNVWDMAILPDGHVYAVSFLVCDVSPDGSSIELAGAADDRPLAYSSGQIEYDPLSGTFWHLNDIGEVSQLNTNGQWERWQSHTDFPGSNSQLAELALTPNGDVWVLTDRDGAYYFQNEAWVASELVNPSSISLYFDEDTRVETRGASFEFVSASQVASIPFQEHPLSSTILSALPEHDGAMTLLHDGSLITYFEDSWSSPDSLIHQGAYLPIYDLVEGVNGTRYALAGQRVWQYINAQWQVVGTAGVNYPATGLDEATVSPDGSLWIFAYQHGLLHYHQGQWTLHEGAFFDISFIPEMACDGNGLLWMYYIQNVSGTVSGMATFDGQNLHIIPETEMGFSPGFVTQIATRGSDVYLASYYEGLVHYDGQQWHRIQPPGITPPTPNRLTAVSVSEQGRIAFALVGQGVLVKDQDTWLHFTPQNSPLSPDPIYRLFWSHDDQDLWVIQQQAEAHIYHGDWATTTTPLDPPTDEGGLLHLYPNPAREVLWIDLSTFSPDKTCELTLCDHTGRRLAQYQCAPGTQLMEWKVAHLPAGAYTVLATDGLSLRVQKWIKP